MRILPGRLSGMQTHPVSDAAAEEKAWTFGVRLADLGKQYWHFAFIIALSVVLWAPRLQGPIDLRWDAGVYYVLGTSLASGHGYRIISEPGAPEAVQYPPLLPGVVALYQMVLRSADPSIVGPWLRLSYAVFFLAYGVALLILAKRYLPAGLAVVVATICLLHHSTIFLSDLLFTEIPFALISIVFVLLAADGSKERHAWWREPVCFLLAAAGFLLRTAGVVLFAAWVVEAILGRRSWRLALCRLLLALLPIALWQGYVMRVQRSEEYRHPAYDYQRAPYQFYNVTYADNMLLLDPDRPERGRAAPSALAARVIKNFRYVIKAAGESMSTSDFYWRQSVLQVQKLLFKGRPVPLNIVLGPIVGLACLAAVGMIMLVWNGRWLMVLYTVGSIALVCTAPWRSQFPRYLAPVAPFFLIAAAVAASRAFDRARSGNNGKMIPFLVNFGFASALAVILGVQIDTAFRLYRDRARTGVSYASRGGANGIHYFYHDRLWRGWEQAMTWIDQNASADAIIATPASHFCYLQTGRRAVSPPKESNFARARHLFASVPVSYVVIDRGYNLPAIETDAKEWHLTGVFEGTRIYERKSGAAGF